MSLAPDRNGWCLVQVPVQLRLFSYLHPDLGFYAFRASLREAPPQTRIVSLSIILTPPQKTKALAVPGVELDLVSLRPHEEYKARPRSLPLRPEPLSQSPGVAPRGPSLPR